MLSAPSTINPNLELFSCFHSTRKNNGKNGLKLHRNGKNRFSTCANIIPMKGKQFVNISVGHMTKTASTFWDLDGASDELDLKL